MRPTITTSPRGLDPEDDVRDLDAAATLTAARDSMRGRRQAEVHDLLVVAHWADLHSHPASEDPDAPTYARERMIQPGGDGTPSMREFALAELGCEPWVARKVATITRHLDRDRVGLVDRAVAKAIAVESPAVVLELARAKTIEADPGPMPLAFATSSPASLTAMPCGSTRWSTVSPTSLP